MTRETLSRNGTLIPIYKGFFDFLGNLLDGMASHSEASFRVASWLSCSLEKAS